MRKLNAFNLSHEHKLTCEMGYLIPNLLLEVVPGDTFDIKSSIFARAEAMLAPVMHRYDIVQHYFYWPKRCAMPKHWEDYITGGEDGTDNTTWPYMMSPSTGYARGSLGDYLGLPCDTRTDTSANSTETSQIQSAFPHSAVPFRMYAEIFNYWYRNENLQSKLTWSDQPGLDNTTNTTLQKKNWPKDYFTGALDRTERGSPTFLPFDGVDAIPVVTSSTSADTTGWPAVIVKSTTNGGAGTSTLAVNSSNHMVRMDGGTGQNQKDVVPSNLVANGGSAISLSYRDFQLTARMALFKRRLERAGSRLVEWTSEFFGVRVPDDRICKPIFLGGFRCPLMITPVEQTSSTDNVSPQGNLAGRGTSSGSSKKIRRSFVEEGLIMGIMCIMPKAEYSQGLPKLWSRKTRWDHFVPMFDVAGDQEIPNKEIFTQGASQVDSNGEVIDEKTFGYKPAFEELRRVPSSVHGEMRKGGSLTFWTGGRLFDSLPQLNSAFVTADPSNRIFAVTAEGVQHFTVEAYHEIRALRLLDKYGNPSII